MSDYYQYFSSTGEITESDKINLELEKVSLAKSLKSDSDCFYYVSIGPGGLFNPKDGTKRKNYLLKMVNKQVFDFYVSFLNTGSSSDFSHAFRIWRAGLYG